MGGVRGPPPIDVRLLVLQDCSDHPSMFHKQATKIGKGVARATRGGFQVGGGEGGAAARGDWLLAPRHSNWRKTSRTDSSHSQVTTLWAGTRGERGERRPPACPPTPSQRGTAHPPG